MEKNSISRRSFLKSSALAGAAGMVGTGTATGLFTSCQTGDSGPKYTPLKEPGTYYLPDLAEATIEGKALKVGLIGCGGQGSGDLRALLRSVKGVTVTALGDTYMDRLMTAAKIVKDETGNDVPENMRFTGLDAYKQVIDSGIDAVMIVTPPYFRPIHFKYAVEKGLHCFMEKPLFVDSAGYRSAITSARQAQSKNLAVIVGTQRHHERIYVAAHEQIMNGLIGEITGGIVYWNQSQLWFNERKPEYKSDLEWMIRDWVNWTWLSGDHIVEQHVHNIDVFTWFSGLRPAKAIAVGGRHRRVTGDQYDCFGVDFTMENGIHVASMCRQITGCSGPVGEFIQGTKGSWSNAGEIKDLKGEVIWKYDRDAEKENFKINSPTQLELIAWINFIRSGKSIDQASELAVSNMMALMGRQAAYTGQEVTWDAITATEMDLTPPDLSFTEKMDMTRYSVPVPGRGPGAGRRG